MAVSQDDLNAVKRNYYVTALGLSMSTNLSLSDLEYRFYSNPPASGGGGGLDLTNATGQLNADKIIAGTTNNVITTAEKTKLSNIQANATANSSDATLLNRLNHTGAQLATSISDFIEASQDVIGALLRDGVGFDVTYDDAGNLLTIAVTGSTGYKIFWNPTLDVWESARPAPDGIHFYEYISTIESTATQAPDMVIGDDWTRHPSAIG